MEKWDGFDQISVNASDGPRWTTKNFLSTTPDYDRLLIVMLFALCSEGLNDPAGVDALRPFLPAPKAEMRSFGAGFPCKRWLPGVGLTWGTLWLTFWF